MTDRPMSPEAKHAADLWLERFNRNREPAPARAIGPGNCARCGAPVNDAGLYTEDLCFSCALAAGEEEKAKGKHGTETS